METRKMRTSRKRVLYWLPPLALVLGLVLLVLGNISHFPSSNIGFWFWTCGWILVVLGVIGTYLAWVLYYARKWPW